MNWLAFFQDYTIQTVALGAATLGVISGVLGSFAVLRRQSLLGDVLSHAALPGICIGFLVAGSRHLGALLAGAFLTAALAALVVLLLVRRSRLKTDAALGVVLSVFFAVGVVLLTRIQATGGAGQAGLSSFLFGQAAAMVRSDLWVMGAITFSALMLVGLLWKELKLASFDPGFAASLGLPVRVLEVVLTVMIALAIVVGLQLVGVVLMTAMLIAPAAAARQWTSRLEIMVLLAAGFGVAAGVSGALISATGRGLSTGPLIVLAATFLVLVSIAVAPGRGLLWEALRAYRHRRALRARQVLLTLRALARSHDDPDYRSEMGMIDTYHGGATHAALTKLAARGLVREVQHPPEMTPHWELTEAGHVEADALARDTRAEGR